MSDDVGKTTVAQDKEIEEFDKAFDEVVDKEDQDETPPADQEKDESVKEEKEEHPEKTPDSVIKPIPDEKTPEQTAGDEKASEDKTDWKAEAARLKIELEQEQHRTKSWGGRISAANDRAVKAEKKVAELEEKLKESQSQDKGAQDSLPDDDDELALSNFLKEFPDLEKPLRTLIRKEAGVRKEKQEKPDNQTHAASDTSAGSDDEFEKEQAVIEHWRRIKAKHGDLFAKDENVLQDPTLFNQWISSQPPLIKKQFEGYVQKGTTDEIIEMLDLYKSSVKSKQSKSKESLDQQASDLEAVEHHPGNPPKDKGTKDKDDFDGGWEEATEEEKKAKR